VPWKIADATSQRAEFVRIALAGDQPFSAVCRRFCVSRTTGYKWLSRSRSPCQDTPFADRSRRAHTIHRIPAEVRQRVLELRLSQFAPREIASQLCSQGVQISSKTVQRILCEEGAVGRVTNLEVPWIAHLYTSHQPQTITEQDVPNAKCACDFTAQLERGCQRDRVKAVAVLARIRGIQIRLIADALNISAPTVIRYMHLYEAGGVDLLFRHPKSKVDDEPHREAVIGMLHSPPDSHGINRTSWIMDDLHRVRKESGHQLSERRIRRIINDGGFKWRRARVVLTSNDPEYEKKLGQVKNILSGLSEDEAFFSIDEYGPFAVKKKPGRKRVPPGEQYVVPQWQKSKGWLILTAALELARNQVTHFYSRAKNTDEMIRMADLLCWFRVKWSAGALR
jgi:transposase